MNEQDPEASNAASRSTVRPSSPTRHSCDSPLQRRHGIKPHPDLDPALRGRFAFRRRLATSVQALPNPAEALRKLRPTPEGYRFSSQGKAALGRFLHTLADKPLLTDEKLADPVTAPRWPVITGVASGGGAGALD